VFCPEHVPLTGGVTGNAGYANTAYSSAPRPDADQNPYLQSAAPVHTSPGLAFLLGLIPGVGAIYNGQYLKGFIHVAILGVLISIVQAGHHADGAFVPFFGLLIAAWIFYMPFEAYHTARKRQAGVPVDEWSSLLPRGASGTGRLPVGPIVLIAIGVLFLLDNLGLLPLSEILRFWPLILIAIGVYSLYSRLSGPLPVVPPPPPPPGHAASSPSPDVNGGAA
jgi:multisubunit Na+/H+ antiporter MnhB subunit